MLVKLTPGINHLTMELELGGGDKIQNITKKAVLQIIIVVKKGILKIDM